MSTLEIVKLAGDEKIVELRDAVFAELQDKVNELIAAKRADTVTRMFAKEGYDGNTPDEKSLLAKLLRNISKHDYPVENKDDLPFKALNTHPTGPAGDHQPAPEVQI